MDEATFLSYVEFVRRSFVDYKRDLWETPAKRWAYEYKSLPEGACGGFLQGLISGSGETKLEWDSVSLIVQELLREGDPLPAELAEWVADVLEGKRSRPTTGGQTKSGRDRMIYLVVYHVADRFKLKPTRRWAQGWGQNVLPDCCAEGGSACDVVGAAFGVKYKTAERAWNERDPLLQS